MTLNELVPGLEQARASEQASSASLQRAEAALADWQERWDAHALQLNESQQQQHVESTRAEQLESRLQSFADRRKKIEEAQGVASPEDLQANHDELADKEMRKRQARDEFDRHLADIGEKIRKLREQDKKLTSLVEERHTALQDAKGKFASLEALQQAALGEADDGVQAGYRAPVSMATSAWHS